ncbi:S-adenosyl-L-methionine-dependent methyltransferase [Haematococcus lacustris]
MHERGVQFVSDRSFYRAESAQARDLAVLAVSVFKSRSPDQPFRVLDVMAGSGVRGARYLQQAGVDAVWCNDHNSSVHNELVMNLCGGVAHLTAEEAGERQGRGADPLRPSVRVSHMDAQRLLAACYLAEDYYDLIDIDSFGSDTSFLGSALDALKHGGLLFLTSTDGFSSAGLRPTHSLAAYGAYLRALPCANEQGLRMLIGAAVREGASRGLALSPVFSLYSYHGPVFRVMLRATRSALWPAQHYAFLAHCHLHGTTRAQHWRHLSDAVCRCNEGKPGVRPTPLVLSGPLWTGPLHCAKVVGEMQQEAARRGWNGHSWSTSGSSAVPDAGERGAQPGSPPTTHAQLATPGSRKHKARPLEALLALLLEESDPRLPPGFLPLDVLGRHLVRFPQRDQLIQQLRDAGFAAARCHLDDKALRTNASFQACMAAARSLGIAAREDDSFASPSGEVEGSRS